MDAEVCRELISAHLQKYPSLLPEDVAETLLPLLTPAERDIMAWCFMREYASTLRRNSARYIETCASARHAFPEKRWRRLTDKEKREREAEKQRRREEHYAQMAPHREKLADCLRSAVSEYAAAIRLEVTSELLATLFAVGDGSERVTWGDATVDQHERRVEMLLGNAAGNAETAARHTAAINLINSYGVICLKEIVNECAIAA